jgi:hypothetical protein
LKRLAVLAAATLFGLMAAGCGAKEDVSYGGEVKTAPGGAGAAKQGTAKPMGAQPSLD